MQDNLSGIENPKTVNTSDSRRDIRSCSLLANGNAILWLVLLMKVKARGWRRLFCPDEDSLDATHSVYADQWDWEKLFLTDIVISRLFERNCWKPFIRSSSFGLS